MSAPRNEDPSAVQIAAWVLCAALLPAELTVALCVIGQEHDASVRVFIAAALLVSAVRSALSLRAIP